MEIKTDINSGRKTHVTSQGDEIDVVSFIAGVWKHSPLLVSAGIHEAEGTTPRKVNEMLMLNKADMGLAQ
jgi:hypothetical protein